MVTPERAEARLRALFENTPEALTFFDCEGRLTDANPGTARLLGTPVEALIGQPCERLVAPAFHGEIHALFARVLAGESCEAEIALQRGDGSEVPAHVAVGPLRIGETIAGAFVCARDVSLEHVARENLEQSEERFRSIFDNNPDPMIAFDGNGTVTRANAAAGRILEIDSGDARRAERSATSPTDADIDGCAGLFQSRAGGDGRRRRAAHASRRASTRFRRS